MILQNKIKTLEGKIIKNESQFSATKKVTVKAKEKRDQKKLMNEK